MPPVIDPEKCTACGMCAEYCAEDVFFGSEDERVPKVSYPEFCAHCSCCVYVCPVEAIWRITRSASGPSLTLSTKEVSTFSPSSASIACRPMS